MQYKAVALVFDFMTTKLGKLHATGCEGRSIWVGLIMFGKLGTGSKERIP